MLIVKKYDYIYSLMKKMKQVFYFEIQEQKENSTRFRVKRDTQYLSFKEVFELWRNSSEFVRFYVATLIKLNYQAFYWEHPAINKGFLKKKYECVVQQSQRLTLLAVNETAFERYLYVKEEVADFMNLGKNARLVIPTKKTKADIYNHMGKFIRMATEQQLLALFKRVGKVIKEAMEKQQLIWLSTAGEGVIWLHVRLDTSPKYYKTAAYKNPNFLSLTN